MKPFLTLTLLVFFSNCFAQQYPDYQTILEDSWRLFQDANNQKELEDALPIYHHLESLLKKAIELNPKSGEARYLLGSVYSQINSYDGMYIINMTLNKVIEASEQFEQIMALNQRYEGKIYLLDPPSKIGSEWGCMALSYLYHNKTDSAKWAFKEGKKRGGYSAFELALNKQLLDACDKGAYLFTSGDKVTIPIAYLQTVEGYRTDVRVIDLNLLNTAWYPSYLTQKNGAVFGFSNAELDSISYELWTSKPVKIKDFVWVVAPSFQGQYLLRGDLLLLGLLKTNLFKRAIYFLFYPPQETSLSLTEYLYPQSPVEKLIFTGQVQKPSLSRYKKRLQRFLALSDSLSPGHENDLKLFKGVRAHFLQSLKTYLDQNNKKSIEELLEIIEQSAKEKEIPLEVAERSFIETLREKL